jgi:hypothetical protein
MRNRFRVLILVGLIGAIVVPVVIALTSKTGTPRAAEPATAVMAATVVAAPVVVQSASGVAQPLPEGAALFIVGAVLIGAAAAVRRSSRSGPSANP